MADTTLSNVESFSAAVGGHPMSDLFANRRANSDGIPIMHATVFAYLVSS